MVSVSPQFSWPPIFTEPREEAHRTISGYGESEVGPALQRRDWLCETQSEGQTQVQLDMPNGVKKGGQESNCLAADEDEEDEKLWN